ncbi:DegT/DnrJ/EryC1/StrS family aminotransferase [Thermodesulfobacteriota bacterium]
MIPFIDLKAQQERIRPQIEERIKKILDHGQYIMGPEINELEEKLAEFTGAKHAITCSSGTDALLMVLMAWGVGPGDAVFTTPFSFIATAEVISLLGATPVFVDIDQRTFNIDPEKLDLAIQAVKENNPSIYPIPNRSLKPKAIIPVDLFGLPADYDNIRQIANEHGLKILADAAQSFGGEYKRNRVGTLGHATATSFFPAKPLGCYGDGGAIFTDNDNLAEKLASIRVHGKGTDKYDNIRVGLNARLDTLQAAILLPKLEIFPDELEARQKVAQSYSEQLASQTTLPTVPFIPEGYKSAWAQYSILAEQRDAMQTKLQNGGIPATIYYPIPLHRQKAFEYLGYRNEDFPTAEQISKQILSLPMHPYLTAQQVQKIVEVFQKCSI